MSDEDRATRQSAAAVSIDGRHFQFAGGTGSRFEPGGLVVLRSTDGGEEETDQLGQVEEVAVVIGGAPQGSGRILGLLDGDGRHLDVRRSVPFGSATIRSADARTAELLYGDAATSLPIGSFLASQDIPARLLAQRFNRHTFWCGQSGSGKTYALGVVLEQLLLHTALPMVIFDPNADFVHMRQAHPAATTDARRALADRDIRVLRPSSPSPDALRVRFLDLSLRAKAAVFRLDPLDDRAEHNELMHIEDTVGLVDPARVVPGLVERGTPAARDLAARTENLRVTDWSVWAQGLAAVTDILDSRPDATVLDLGGFAYPEESLVVALAVLDDLWAKREQRRPLLIVIDEAHNFCSPDQTSPLHVAVRERIVQIAAEGRKFGLWLLLSTQRPFRVHPSIISQCDNLALMKMTSPVDLAELANIFGFVPPAMLARASRFKQGEALFAGGFVPAPTMVTMGPRLTREGGADVSVPLRTG
ncbi:ATP-binding protein [Cryobacterium sp. 1639]|uniref:ATP-binding protein n=1 Tax=Cryobacterium inferilacus TaxID=2866629 RepID=UPI001C72F255|nr:ATP-binding protein [Cryobacterium sp. 1639]MBX0301604.1 ATP-binding protein [Cryobacterium sp. 1639]